MTPRPLEVAVVHSIAFGLVERSLRGGGDGDVVGVDVELRRFMVASKRPSELLWLDVLDSILKRLDAGGCELRSSGEAFLLSPAFLPRTLLAAPDVVLGKCVERGLDWLETCCCFCA